MLSVKKNWNRIDELISAVVKLDEVKYFCLFAKIKYCLFVSNSNDCLRIRSFSLDQMIHINFPFDIVYKLIFRRYHKSIVLSKSKRNIMLKPIGTMIIGLFLMGILSVLRIKQVDRQTAFIAKCKHLIKYIRGKMISRHILLPFISFHLYDI